MSKIEVNTVEPQCGTTLTLGASGDTVALGSGASQTGFGRTGTVDWVTTVQTSTITAATGKGYFVNTTAGAITANLPAGAAGSIVSFQDYANTFDSNALTIAPNGSEKINGGAGALILGTEGQGITLVYIDSTQGWKSIVESDFSGVGNNYIAATGGTIATSGDYKTHKFTGPGTFCVSNIGPASSTVDYLVVAGGAGGGTSGGGGGGAGGFRLFTSQPITIAGFPVVVGGGGAKGCCSVGGSGSVSTFKCNSSAGGGGGGQYGNCGVAGGSGGGGGSGGSGTFCGGAGNTPATPVSQGNAGGNGTGSPQPQGRAGGGGGAAAVGSNQVSAGLGGPGGNGTDVSPTFGPGYGDSNFFSGGGGGGAQSNPGFSAGAPTGGNGGGGTGGGAANPYGSGPGSGGSDGTVNTGGGGGGNANAPGGLTAGAGGSGIVLIRYKFQN